VAVGLSCWHQTDVRNLEKGKIPQHTGNARKPQRGAVADEVQVTWFKLHLFHLTTLLTE